MSKGPAGEREFCQWLWDELGIEAKRKLGQARDEGADILVGDFVIEVKRQERLALKHWWLQVCLSEPGTKIVAFRQNRQPWRFLISATHIGLENGFIQLEERVGKLWLQKEHKLKKEN